MRITDNREAIPQLVSVESLSKAWGVRPGTVREWLRTGKLPKPVYIGRKPLIPLAELQRLVEDQGRE